MSTRDVQRQMFFRFFGVAGAVLVIIIGGLIYFGLHAPRRGELFDKRGWSVVQGMEDPNSPRSRVILARRAEYDIVGFRGVGVPTARIHGVQPKWSWILLNEHHADGDIKHVPKFGSYDLPCSELMWIERTARSPDGYAIKYLRSICH